MWDESDWSRVEEGEEELECPLPLECHLQELLSREEVFPAGAGVEDGLPQTLIPNNPVPYPMENAEWIPWNAQQVDTPAWWQELQGVLGHNDHWEFAGKVQALFNLPKVQSHVMGVDSDHSAPLDSGEIHIYATSRSAVWQLRLLDCAATEDPCLHKALQYWAEKTQLPVPVEPHHLVESVLELWQMMEPLVSFTDEEVLKDVLHSNWVEISLPELAEPAPWDCNHSCQTHPRGSLLAAHGKTTSSTNHYHCPDDLTNHSDPGGGTMTGKVWKPAPDPSTGVCRDCAIPARGWLAICHHWDPSWRGWPTQPVWDCGINVNSDLTDPTPHNRGGSPRHDKLNSQHGGSGAWPCCGGLPGHSPRGTVWQQRLSFPLEMSDACSPTSKVYSFTIWHVCYDVHIPDCSVKTLLNVQQFYRLHCRQLFYSRGLDTRIQISNLVYPS